MSENPALEAHEHREHAEHAAEAHDPLISRVSVTIAALAVITAIVGSVEITESGGAITASSRAVLAQDQATDAWSAYQAASIKKHLYDLAPPSRADAHAQSQKFASDQAGYQAQAKAGEAKREAAIEESERHERRHHRLTLAATLLQIGIAISTVAIITRRRPFWIGSLVLGAAGLVAAASAFLG